MFTYRTIIKSIFKLSYLALDRNTEATSSYNDKREETEPLQWWGEPNATWWTKGI